jgi:predicted AAA+ superfamily ATPase
MILSALSPNYPKRAILDEVQRVPEIFTSLKSVIDRGRSAGRFILTGSPNVLLIPKLADSLAGRLGLLRLHPLAQCEVAASRSRFLDDLLTGNFRSVGSQRGDVPGTGTWWKHRFSATCETSRAFTHPTHCPDFLRWRPLTQRD